MVVFVLVHPICFCFFSEEIQLEYCFLFFVSRYPEVDPIILSVDETTEVSIKDVVEHIVRAMDFKVRYR